MRMLVALLVCAGLSGIGHGQTFIVTDRPVPQFVVTHSPAQFVVTDRTAAVPAVPVDTRPWVTGYTATWCRYCPTAKAALEAKAKDSPFQVKWVDVTNGGPAWCDSLPAFEWEHGGKRWCAKGWVSVDNLIGRWKASQAPPAAATVKSELDALSPQQREMVQQALNAGWSIEQIRRYAKSRGLISK